MAFEPEEFAGKVLRLHSPASQGTLEISWPENKDVEIYQARIKELIDTVKFVIEDFPSIRVGLKSDLFDFEEKRNYKNAQTLVARFNKSVQLYIKINKGSQEFSQKCQRRASTLLLDHMLKQVYRQSITDPQSLNKYQSFTSETYGETNYQQMDKIIAELQWSENDVFVDLGSGIGSIVMQVASGTSVGKAVGIEIQPNPNKCAKDMDKNFHKMMRWYGKVGNPYDLYDGNFLNNVYKDVRSEKETTFDWRQEATIIFVNNFAFNEDLNQQLKEIFADMPDETRIVSTKAFCPVDFKITDRNAGNHIGCFMRVEELNSINDGFSWTAAVVQVFLSTIDRSKLEDYYAAKTQKKNKVGKDRSSSNSPIDFVEAKPRIKTQKEMRKMSKGRVVEPEQLEILDKSTSGKRDRKANGRGRPPTKGSRTLQDVNMKTAFDVFHKDQVNSHRNNHVRQSLVSNKQIDDAWEKATEEWKRQFKDSVSMFLNMSERKLDHLMSVESASLAKLDKMVKDEEHKIAELRQTNMVRCRQSIATQCNIREQKCVKRENQAEDEDRQIKMLQQQILGQRRLGHGGHTVISNGQLRPKLEHGASNQIRPSIIKQRPVAMPRKSREPDARQKFGFSQNPMPSPHSIPQSPHSMKSSPSSDIKSSDPHTNALLDAGLQSQIVLSPRTEKETLKQVENPANPHFPINLTPTPTLGNSCESSGNNSPSSSIYGSPRSKRKRRTESIDSDRSSSGAPGAAAARLTQQSVITATNVQTSTSSTQRQAKNTSSHQRVPPPQISLVPSLGPQPTVLIPAQGVITNARFNGPATIQHLNGHGMAGHGGGHSTVLRQPMHEDAMPDGSQANHQHLYGGLTHGFLHNGVPAQHHVAFSNNTDVKELKEKRKTQSPKVATGNGLSHANGSEATNGVMIPGAIPGGFSAFYGFPFQLQHRVAAYPQVFPGQMASQRAPVIAHHQNAGTPQVPHSKKGDK